MSKSQRTKGAAAEREVAKILQDALGVEVKRKLGQARDSGDDIQVGRYRLEVKRQETLRMQEWCEQVEAACGPQDVPVVVYRRSGQPWRVVLLLDDLIPMMRGDL
jgi:Holliday junction resolvase